MREGDAVSSITVERTGFGIIVAAQGDLRTGSLLDGLPPLKAARYLVATPALQQSLREAAPEVVDAVRPHLDGTVVVPSEGLGGEGEDGAEADGARLARVLGVPVVAPDGRFLPCSGTLFSVGKGDGWVTRSPQGARVPSGRRYPAPAWQHHLPANLPGIAHIPAGLWVTAGAEAQHAVRLAGVAVREEQLLVVVGSPAEPPPSRERLETVLRALPPEALSVVALVGYGPRSLDVATVRDLAAALKQPLRVAHGVEIGGASVRLDGDATTPPTLAIESVCAPDGSVRLDRWETPAGLVHAASGGYRIDDGSRANRRASEEWRVHIVPAGLIVAPAGVRPVAAGAAAPIGDSLQLSLQCDGARRPNGLPRLLAPLLARLERLGTVTIHPLDATARRVVRDAYPGRWAPVEAVALTADGRLVAATMDASGDTRTTVGTGAVVDADPVSSSAESGHVKQASERTGAPAQAVASAAIPRPAPMGPLTVDPVVGGASETRPQRESGSVRRVGAAPASARGRRAEVTSAPTTPVAQPSAPAEHAPVARSAPPAAAAPPAEHAPAATLATSGRATGPTAASGIASSPDAAPPVITAVPKAADFPAAPPTGLTRALRGSVETPAPGAAARPVSASDPGNGRPTAPRDPAERVAPATSLRASMPEPVTIAAPALATTAARDRPAAPAADDAAARGSATVEAPGPASPPPSREPERAPAASAPTTRRRLEEVPVDVRSTAEQRHRVRTALGPRYDVASRTVSQLLAQQPGMRASAGDRSAMLTGLSLVRVFAADPHADYDLDFHVCLAEGLAMLPTARAVVVRGIPSAVDAAPGDVLRLRMPLIAAAADGPATGPAEALIWTTSGRRLDRVLHGVTGAADIALPAGLRVRVLEAGRGARLLLAEEGAGAQQALGRLQAASEARGDLRAHTDDRWFGDLPSAA